MADEGERRAFSSRSLGNSYNSLYASLPESYRKILLALEQADFPLSPIEIAQKTKIRPNSCRVYLRNLLKKDLIVQPGYGKYLAKKKLQPLQKSRMGRVKVDEGVPLRVHNVRLKLRGAGLGVVRHSERVVLDDVNVAFVWCGGGVITVTVACDRGLGFGEWRIVEGFVLHRLGRRDNREGVEVVSVELNHDFAGLRLDGFKCLTLKSFDGALERFYEKKGVGVRHEVVGPGEGKSLRMLGELMQGGVTAYNVTQTQFMLAENVRELSEAVKGSNRLSVEQGQALKEVLTGLFKRLDKSVSLQEKLLEALGNSDRRLSVVERSLVGLLKSLKRKRRKRRKKKKLSRWEKFKKRLR